jgi:predicted  nucleic acid-binding Zn-ribbon protein
MIDKLKQNLGLILIIASVIALPVGFFNYMGKYALAEEVKELKRSVQYEFKSQQVQKTSERIWQLEDRAKAVSSKAPPDPNLQKDIKRLEEEKKQLELELKELGRKK